MFADEVFPRRVRLARLFLGLTQAELAERMLVAQPWIGQIESGTRQPTPDRILALAEVTGFHSAFFRTPITNEFTEETCHFRMSRTSPAAMRNQAMATGTLFNAVVAHLEEHLDFPPDSIPILRSSSMEIETIAARLRMQWGLTLDRPIANMTRVIERAGALVTRCASGDKVDAFSNGTGPRKLIVVNDGKGASRTRFDLAHELGHLVMHPGMRTGDDVTEREADRFASAFLLPATGFGREFPQSTRIDWNALLALKTRWGVSLQAIITRAHELGKLSALQKTSAFKYISWNGWRKNEPAEPALERPEAIANSFIALEEDGCPVTAAAAALMTTNQIVLDVIGHVYEPKVRPFPSVVPMPTKGTVVAFDPARRRA